MGGQARDPGDLPPQVGVDLDDRFAADLLGRDLLIGALLDGQELVQALAPGDRLVAVAGQLVLVPQGQVLDVAGVGEVAEDSAGA